MDPKVAADSLWASINISELPDEHPEYGKDHLREMLRKLISGEVSGEKAHRWIGWIQGCVCVGKGATLEEMKLINKKA
jgi:hypothetical protein